MQRQKILTLHHSSALECCPYAIAAEQKARVTYDNILRLSDDPDVSDAIKFLRAREIVHFQRFGEAKRTRGRGRMPSLAVAVTIWVPDD